MRTCSFFVLGSFLVLSLVGCGGDGGSQSSGLGRSGGEPPAPGDPAPGKTGSGVVDPPAGRTVSYSRDVQPIWDARCVGCHAERAPVLTRDRSYASLTQGKASRACTGERPAFVVPGDPAKSYLFYKLTRESSLTITDTACKRPMPASPTGPDRALQEIDGEAVKTISTWIAEGAGE